MWLQLEDESTAVSMKNPIETRSLIVAEFYTNGISTSNVLYTQRLTEMVHRLIIYESHQRLLKQALSIDVKNV
jgi:hypothetical protein